MPADVYKAFHDVVKGGIALFITGVIAFLIKFASKVILAIRFGAGLFGVFTFGASLLSACLGISLLGTQNAIPRLIAAERDEQRRKRIAFSGLVIVVVSSLAAVLLILLALFTNVLHVSGSRRLYILPFILAIPFAATTNLLSSIARGYKDTTVSVKVYNIFSTILFALAVGIALFTGSFFLFILLYAAMYVVLSLSAYVYVQRRRYVTWSFDPRIMRLVLVTSVPLLVAAVALMLLSRVDALMLGLMKNAVEVGIYGVAFALASLIPFALNATNYLYLPIVSEYIAEGKHEDVKRLYSILTKWMVAIVVPVASVYMLFPTGIITLVYGHQYVIAASVLVALAMGFALHTALGANGLTMIAYGENKVLSVINIAALLIDVCANLVLIPSLGALGAAIATTLALVFINIAVTVYLLVKYSIHPFSSRLVLPILLSVVFYTAGSIVDRFGRVFAVPSFIVAIAVYAAILYALGFLEEEDKKLLHRLAERMGVKQKGI